MLTFNQTSFNQVTFNGTEMKRIILNDQNMWAQEYTLTVNSNMLDAAPTNYVYWSTLTDPESGADQTKCHYGEVIRTRLCDNGSNRIALPTGAYPVTGNTNIYAQLYKFSIVSSIDVQSENTGVIWNHNISCLNPLSSYDSYNTIKHTSQNDLANHYKLYIQWACLQNGTWTAGQLNYLGSNLQGAEVFYDGVVFRYGDIDNSKREIEISTQGGSQKVAVRVTQVIAYDGAVAIRQSERNAGCPNLHNLLSSPWEDDGTSVPEWT